MTESDATVTFVKIVAQVTLIPDPVQALALERTLPEINEAANWASAVAHRPARAVLERTATAIGGGAGGKGTVPNAGGRPARHLDEALRPAA